MTKITKTVNSEGVASYAEVDTTFLDYIAAPLKGALAAFSSTPSDTFYDEKTVGLTVVGFSVASVLVGHRYGDDIPLVRNF